MSKSRARIRIKQQLYRDQAGCCHWCDKPVYLQISGTPLPPNTGTLDHVFTKGDPRRGNHKLRERNAIEFVLACHPCNNERGGMPYDDFLKLKRPEWA